MKPTKNLILTGWGWKDYACAAALALRHWKDADVYGMSTRRLPEYLNKVKGYENIIILGIGLTGNPELLEQALTKQKEKSVHIFWLSALPIPESISDDVKALFEEIFVKEDTDGITDVVSHCYNLSYDDIRPLTAEDTHDKAILPWHQLIEAAMYAYRNYQDEKTYGNAIRHIAAMKPPEKWTSSEKQLIEHYKRYGDRELVGKSKTMQDLVGKINMVASHPDVRVIIYGETGTGKEAIAWQIHSKSPRRNEPYITFNCACVAETMLESTFYGNEKGAFTDAKEMYAGLFEQADGGTLFLDEIAELPFKAQGILLRILEVGRFTRLHGNKEISVDVRVITATNKDLAAMVRNGTFREDLFYRLNVVQICAPPLRKHKTDIEQIANSFWMKQHQRRLEPEQVKALNTYDFPGNVRELFHMLEYASVFNIQDFNQLITEYKQTNASLLQRNTDAPPEKLEDAIRWHVKHIYEKYAGKKSKTAEALDISPNTVRKYINDDPSSPKGFAVASKRKGKSTPRKKRFGT